MLPDVKGNIPDFKPKMDKLPNVQFEDPWVAMPPAKK